MFTRTWSEILAMLQVLTLVVGNAQSFYPRTVKNHVAVNENFLIRRFSVPDWMSCIVACNNTPGCFSYNYQYINKKNGLRELLGCGVDQQRRLDDELLYSYGFVFQQLKEHEEMKRCSTGCWIGWTPFRSHCYKVVDQEKTWEDASEFCKNKGTNLAFIRSQEENEFLADLVCASLSKSEFWIGIKSTDCPDFQTLCYSDGTKISYSKAYIPSSESCTSLIESNRCHCIKVSGHAWFYANCGNHQLPFVCKL